MKVCKFLKGKINPKKWNYRYQNKKSLAIKNNFYTFAKIFFG